MQPFYKMTMQLMEIFFAEELQDILISYQWRYMK